MKKIFSADTPIEAHLFKNWLATQGIAATVSGDDIALNDSMVWVDDNISHTQIRELISAFLGLPNQAPQTGENWPCPSCGEVMEAQFVAC